MKILADRVLILPDAAERVTPSGLFLADTVTSTERDHVTGIVKGVGAGHHNDFGQLLPVKVQIGQRVLYNRHAGHELDVLDIAHVIVRENDIVGVVG